MPSAILSKPTKPLQGEAAVPGDKSLSHRLALASLFNDECVRLESFNPGADCEHTLHCLEKLGKRLNRTPNGVALSGSAGFPACALDCGNSGTSARLLMGILAGRKGCWTITGDASLSLRPMERVARPLRLMGARLDLADGKLPARIEGGGLAGIEYESPVASAQVKSAVLFAAHQAEGPTRYREPYRSRDHTEKLLGIEPDSDGWLVYKPQDSWINSDRLSRVIPGDPSAAAFWIAATLLMPGSEMIIRGLLLNPTRSAYLRILGEAGADITVSNVRFEHGEQVGDVAVKHTRLQPLRINGENAALCIDEIPVLSVIAASVDGQSEFSDIGELRHKESDRFALTGNALRSMGADVMLFEDSFKIRGGRRMMGADIRTDGDHRLCMAFAVASLITGEKTIIRHADSVCVSDPLFWTEWRRLFPDTMEWNT